MAKGQPKVAWQFFLGLSLGRLLRNVRLTPPPPPISVAHATVEPREDGQHSQLGVRLISSILILIACSIGIWLTRPRVVPAETFLHSTDIVYVTIPTLGSYEGEPGLAPQTTLEWQFEPVGGPYRDETAESAGYEAVLTLNFRGDSANIEFSGRIAGAHPRCTTNQGDELPKGETALERPGSPKIGFEFQYGPEEIASLEPITCRFDPGVGFSVEENILSYTEPRLVVERIKTSPFDSRDIAAYSADTCLISRGPSGWEYGAEPRVRERCGKLDGTRGSASVYGLATELLGETMRVFDDYRSQARDAKIAIFGVLAGIAGAALLSIMVDVPHMIRRSHARGTRSRGRRLPRSR